MSNKCRTSKNCAKLFDCTNNNYCDNCDQWKNSDDCLMIPGCCEWGVPPNPPPGPGPGFNQICKMLEKEVDIECKELKKMLPNYNSCKKMPEKRLFVNTLTMEGCNSKTANYIYDKLNNCFCKKLSTGEIVGIVIGSLVGLGLIIFLSVYFTKKNKKSLNK